LIRRNSQGGLGLGLNISGNENSINGSFASNKSFNIMDNTYFKKMIHSSSAVCFNSYCSNNQEKKSLDHNTVTQTQESQK
jgi:hypothetical protein